MGSTFEALNQILTGEHMAIQKYQAYIDSIADSPLRNHLVAMMTHHKDRASRLSYFIQTNGGYVKEGTGLKGAFSAIESRLKNIRENAPLEMIDELYSGEKRGLDAILKLMEDLDASEKEIVQGIIDDCQEHLVQLERLKEDLLH